MTSPPPSAGPELANLAPNSSRTSSPLPIRFELLAPNPTSFTTASGLPAPEIETKSDWTPSAPPLPSRNSSSYSGPQRSSLLQEIAEVFIKASTTIKIMEEEEPGVGSLPIPEGTPPPSVPSQTSHPLDSNPVKRRPGRPRKDLLPVEHHNSTPNHGATRALIETPPGNPVPVSPQPSTPVTPLRNPAQVSGDPARGTPYRLPPIQDLQLPRGLMGVPPIPSWLFLPPAFLFQGQGPALGQPSRSQPRLDPPLSSIGAPLPSVQHPYLSLPPFLPTSPLFNPFWNPPGILTSPRELSAFSTSLLQLPSFNRPQPSIRPHLPPEPLVAQVIPSTPPKPVFDAIVTSVKNMEDDNGKEEEIEVNLDEVSEEKDDKMDLEESSEESHGTDEVQREGEGKKGSDSAPTSLLNELPSDWDKTYVSGYRYGCPLHCGKSYVNRAHLKGHITSTHLNLNNFYCPRTSCDKKFETQLQLEEHLQTHPKPVGHEQKTYRCPLCTSQFRSKAGLRNHFLDDHA